MKHSKTNMSAILILYFLAFPGFCSAMAELSFHVLEEQPIHTFIGSVNGSSKSNQSSRYLFIEPNKQLFSIDKDSGIIYNAKRIDREDLCDSNPSCAFVVKVRIDSTTYEIVIVNIYIDDINDNAPLFDENETLLKIAENSPVDQLHYIGVSAWDFDSKGNNSAIYYTLLDNENNRFSLIQNKSQLGGLKIKKALDYEEQKFYQLTIVAKDQGIPQRNGSKLINITVLDVNDNAPIFEKVVYNQTILENVPISSTILTLHATDKDSGLNGEVRYKLSHKTSPRIREIFEVKESSGTVILKSSLGDRHQYSFTVIAYDQGLRSHSTSASVTINIVDVNNNYPVIDIKPTVANISESKAIGDSVAYVYVRDEDKNENGKVNCSIAVTNQYFDLKQLHSNFYEIVIINQLDFEDITTHNITIKCEDNGVHKLKSENNIVVNVIDENDNPPIFNSKIKIVNITENNKVPEIVTQMIATDKDDGNNSEIYYHLESDNTSDFTINNRTGLITTNKIFDRETISVLQFRIVAVDCGISALTGTATVQLKILDINDNIPQFQKPHYEFHTLEAQAMDTIIGTVEANDLDAQENGTVSYVIEKNKIASQLFIVIDGILKTKAILNRLKGQKRYDFFVEAIDHGKTPLRSSTNITVIVDDANDNWPYIIYPSDTNNSVSISYEMTAADQPISQVIAYDDDEGENARLSYFLKNTPETTKLFRINQTSGEIMVIKDKHFETLRRAYKLSINVKDHGIPSKNTQTMLFVYMIDGNALVSSNNNIAIILSICVVLFVLFVIIPIAYVTGRKSKLKRRYTAKKYEDASLRRKRNNSPKENEFNNNSGISKALNRSTSEGDDCQCLQGNGNSPETADGPSPEIHTSAQETGTTTLKEPSFQYSNLLCKDDDNNYPTEEIEESCITDEPEVGSQLDRASIKGSCAALLDG